MIARAQQSESGTAKQLERHKETIVSLEQKRRGIDLDFVVKIGDELLAAQTLMSKRGYGTFTKWVEQECGIDKVSAWNYICTAKRFRDTPKEVFGQFRATAAYRLSRPALPVDALDEAIELAKTGTLITEKVALDIVSKYGKRPNARHSRPRGVWSNGHCKQESKSESNGHFELEFTIEEIRERLYLIRDHVSKSQWQEIKSSLHELIDRQERMPDKV